MNAQLDGHYERKQLRCPVGIIAHSHAARFRFAVELAQRFCARRVLDYGCGDGTMLARLAAGHRALELGVGLDIAADEIADCRHRLANLGSLYFDTPDAIGTRVPARSFDLVYCMETLEHCTDAAADRVIADLIAACAPGGRIAISVPIETGPALLVKQAARRLAALRGSRDYAFYEKYTARQLLRQLFATADTPFERPVYGDPGRECHSHFGFNWRRLRKRLAVYLVVEQTCFTPLRWLGAWANSQAWFVTRPRVTAPPASPSPPRRSRMSAGGDP